MAKNHSTSHSSCFGKNIIVRRKKKSTEKKVLWIPEHSHDTPFFFFCGGMRLWQFHIRRTNTVLLDVNKMWKNIQFKNINRCPSVTNKWPKQATALLPLFKATFNLCTLSKDIRDRFFEEYSRGYLRKKFEYYTSMSYVGHIDLSKWERVKFSWMVKGFDSHCRSPGFEELRSQHSPTHRNLRGGRWSSFE